MQKYIIIFLTIVALYSCNNGGNKTENNAKDQDSYQEALDKMKIKAPEENIREVKVIEAEISGSYTYALLEDNGQEVWAAISARELEVGGIYYYSGSMEMKNFESKSLGKVFESILFIDNFFDTKPGEGEKTMASNHKKAQDVHDNIQVDKAANGYSLAEIFEKKTALKDSEIIVKGQVVKLNEAIMNKNWIHIQDGTEYNGLYDLTITTIEDLDFKVGDVVTFKGTLILNKDFGHGYKYDFIIEDAIKQ